jgi:hypothetical protein
MWYTKGVHRDAKERQDPACQRLSEAFEESLSEVASLSVEEALELISATVREGHSDLLREYLPTTWDWIVFITKHVGKAVKPGECNHLNVPTYRYQMIRVAAPAAQAVLWCDRNFKEDPLPLDE